MLRLLIPLPRSTTTKVYGQGGMFGKKNQFSADFLGAKGPHACPIWYFAQSIAWRTASLVFVLPPIPPVYRTKPWNRQPSRQPSDTRSASFFFYNFQEEWNNTIYIFIDSFPRLLSSATFFAGAALKTAPSSYGHSSRATTDENIINEYKSHFITKELNLPHFCVAISIIIIKMILLWFFVPRQYFDRYFFFDGLADGWFKLCMVWCLKKRLLLCRSCPTSFLLRNKNETVVGRL